MESHLKTISVYKAQYLLSLGNIQCLGQLKFQILTHRADKDGWYQGDSLFEEMIKGIS